MDENDLAESYETHATALLRFAASQVGPSDAEDVLSTAVLSVVRRSRQTDERGETTEITDTKSYLYRAVANASAKHWRTIERRGNRNTAFHLHHSRDSKPEQPAEPSEEITAMIAALPHLSVQQRAAVHLTYWEDLTPAMTAERLGVSEGTIRRQLARARAKLREELQ